jgi:hypothetical protein
MPARYPRPRGGKRSSGAPAVSTTGVWGRLIRAGNRLDPHRQEAGKVRKRLMALVASFVDVVRWGEPFDVEGS